jgi:hypothetical protein
MKNSWYKPVISNIRNGWRSGGSAHLSESTSVVPIPRLRVICAGSIELFVGSSRVFLRVLRFFLPPHKSTLLNSNLDSVDYEEPLCGNATASFYLFTLKYI